MKNKNGRTWDDWGAVLTVDSQEGDTPSLIIGDKGESKELPLNPLEIHGIIPTEGKSPQLTAVSIKASPGINSEVLKNILTDNVSRRNPNVKGLSCDISLMNEDVSEEVIYINQEGLSIRMPTN